MALSTVTREMVCGSRSLIVAIRQNAVVVPMFGGLDEIDLDAAGLRLVERLGSGAPSRAELVAEIANETGTDEASVDLLFDQLLERALVVGQPDDGSVRPVVVEEPATPFDPTRAWVFPVPVVLRVTREGFEHLDHEGRVRLRLTSDELAAALPFRVPSLRDDAFEAHTSGETTRSLSSEHFDELIDRLVAAGLLVLFDPDDPVHSERTRQTERLRDAIRRLGQVHAEFDRLEAERDAEGGPADRVPVLAVHEQWWFPPAALGIIVAYAKAYEDGLLQESYDFRPRMLFDEPRLEAAVAEKPVVALFSNYIWCHETNMRHSALLKRVSPHSITVHGGPNTPKFEADAEQFFAENPHVDVTVRGEGEATTAHLLAALRGSVGDGPPDLSVLADVPGLSFRLGDRVIRTEDRDRIADLDTIPSPILTGLFDGFIPVGTAGGLSLETNRGCPYGCTFCDWGSATLSRIRKFDLDRVFAELEWCAKHGFGVGLTDANFGIFERDVEIAAKIADLKRTYGYPRVVGNNYAKNTVKHLSRIIEIFSEVGIVAEGKMSMQSMDEGTLAMIRRKNIKVEKYDELSAEFSKNQLPLTVELMLGLPGSSLSTLRNDLQDCINRDVRAILHTTTLLPNSPMNDPAYREEHGIVARPGEILTESATYSRRDWEEMNRLNGVFALSENFGVLRQVGSYVRAETGALEIDFYERLTNDALRDRERWPTIAITYQSVPNLMVPPVSWRLFVDEVREYLVEVLGLPDDDALSTVLAVQHAMHPARDRSFPYELQLPHDYAAWHLQIRQLRREGHRHDWPTMIKPLRSFGPGSLTIDDPHGVCSIAVGGTTSSLAWESMWEFTSPVSRPRQRIQEDADALELSI